MIPSAKFIIIERSRDEVVHSFDEWTSRDIFVDKETGGHITYNHWQPRSKKASDERSSIYDKSFPTYFSANSKQEAIGMYWDNYVNESVRLVNKYPDSVRIFKFPDILKDAEIQSEMLTFLGVPKSLQVLGLVKRINSRKFRRKKEEEKMTTMNLSLS